MGLLLIGNNKPGIVVEDRPLAHLKVVVFAKFRRHESFSFTWEHGKAGGGGRSSVWLHESIPMKFIFAGSNLPTLNREWLQELMSAANSASGLQLTREPQHLDEHGAYISSHSEITSTGLDSE